MQVKDIMTENPAWCTPNDTLREVAELMRDHDCGCIPVVDDPQSQRILGVITDRDIVCRGLAEGLDPDAEVSTVMSVEVNSCRPGMDVKDLGLVMSDHQVRRVPVEDDRGRLVGIVAQADLALAEDRGISDREVGRVVERISRPSRRRGTGESARPVPLM